MASWTWTHYNVIVWVPNITKRVLQKKSFSGTLYKNESMYINKRVHVFSDLGWFYQKIALIDTLVAWKTVWSWISILSGWTISQKMIINLSSKITMLEDKNTLYVFISKTKEYLFKIMKIHVGWNFSEKLIDIWLTGKKTFEKLACRHDYSDN